MAASLARGRRVTLSKVDAFADGVAVKQVCSGTASRQPPSHALTHLTVSTALLTLPACQGASQALALLHARRMESHLM